VQVYLKDDLSLAKKARNGNKEILETLWVSGREVQVYPKDDLLLAEGNDRLTAWDRASYKVNIDILGTL